MKKFITTKLHASSVKESLHHEANEEEQQQTSEEDESATHTTEVTTGTGGIIVEPKSVPSSLSPSPVVAAVTAMTLNSVSTGGGGGCGGKQKPQQHDADGDDGMAVELPPTLIQPKQPQQSKVQPQHAIITISKPKLLPSALPPSVVSGSTSTAAQVKMCGYLKKKRNKMGGWRKMYFILQNQLLLSYSSKDDYEKKLAPFKDIINLVPGTVIIPTTGPRFTIETNSKVLYTFRCDDHKTCSEWITALLDSLKGDGGGGIGDKSRGSLHGASTLQHHLTHRSLSSLSSSSSSASSTGSSAHCHYATDDPSKMAITSIRRLQQHNLPHPLGSTTTTTGVGKTGGNRPQTHQQQQQQQASLSAPNLFYGFGSIVSSTGAGSGVKVGKLVQLPIASGTARLLERGGANNGQKKYKILTINEVDDDGENDEKPTTTTTPTAAKAVAVAVARDISNGNISRGDPGIKVTTKTSQSSSSDSNNNNNSSRTNPDNDDNHSDGGKRGDKVKHVKSSRSVDSRLVGELKQHLGVVGVVGGSGGGGGGAGGGTEGKTATALANNFRLHTDRGKMHQSVEVCRINSMFSDGGGVGAGRFQQTTTGRGQNIAILAASTGDLRRFGTGSSFASGNNNRAATGGGGGGGGSATDLRLVATRVGGVRPDLLLPAMAMMDSKPLTDINHNNLTKWSADSITIALTENGFSLGGGGNAAGIRSVGSTDTLYRKLKPDPATTSSINCTRSNSHSSDLHRSSQSSSSRTDLNRSTVRRHDSRSPPKRSASGDRAALLGGYQLRSEPIYAVVDMSLKKARRLNQFSYGVREEDLVKLGEAGDFPPSEHSIKVEMVRDSETGRLKERSNIDGPIPLASGSIAPVNTNDYEELSDLTIENFANFDLENSNDDENIYEPINIPEHPLSSNHSSPQPTATGSSQMNSLWRNLKKMNINQLIKRPGTHPDMVHLSNQREEIEADTGSVPPTTKGSTFSELSKKFGHHRRSIKNRMRVLVDRHGGQQQQQQPPPTGGSSSDGAAPPLLLTQSDEKLRKHADSRPLFSTFGRNKKSRKSLSFDDFVPKKKHHQHLQGVVVGVICKADKANDELHEELKRQLSKRSDSSGGSSTGQENKNSLEL
ncbi:uncharacterized protein LOC131690221 isoform X2 [Topomyia yanbarensis]|uniref:uncharacterized protein LOC131690221 isoform X2 n=1 Tax=Topomyia yanbarensis TaxID=2498891 RepID=UPI00273B34C9|nr:uncharacterized protein LOC131690221 isoform X2 [Topomyia yanbarensis]